MKNRQNTAMLACVISYSIFGFSFMFSRIALNYAEPIVMLMYRFLLSFLLINLIAWITSRVSNAPEWLRVNLKGKRLGPLIRLGLMQPVAYFVCESNGINLTNATTAGVFLALIPLVALVLGALFLKEPMKAEQILFAVLSILGIVVMTLQQKSSGQVKPLGIVLLAGAVFSGSLFSVMSRSASEGYTALERTYVMMGAGAVAFTVIAIVSHIAEPAALYEPLYALPFQTSMVFLALGSSILAFLLINFAINDLPVARISAFCNLSTIISVAAGAVFLGEPFNFIMFCASVLIIIGVWGVQCAG